VFKKTKRRIRVYGLRQFSEKIGISPIYLSDIENGKRYAPVNNKDGVLDKIIKKLKIPEEQLDSFYDMAMMSRGYNAFKDYLEYDDNILLFIKYAKELNLSKDEWNLIFEKIDEIKLDRENKKLVLKK